MISAYSLSSQYFPSHSTCYCISDKRGKRQFGDNVPILKHRHTPHSSSRVTFCYQGRSGFYLYSCFSCLKSIPSIHSFSLPLRGPSLSQHALDERQRNIGHVANLTQASDQLICINHLVYSLLNQRGILFISILTAIHITLFWFSTFFHYLDLNDQSICIM